MRNTGTIQTFSRYTACIALSSYSNVSRFKLRIILLQIQAAFNIPTDKLRIPRYQNKAFQTEPSKNCEIAVKIS